jgi:uncharacterized 2Fe-2S/4Fe-4S cluster protein (DUF4445 family)
LSEKKRTVTFPQLGCARACDVGDNLLDVIRTEGMLISADCGGVGRCGKCRVAVNGKERLACLTHVTEDVRVEPPDKPGDVGYAILTDSHEGTGMLTDDGASGPAATDDGASGPAATDDGVSGCAIAVDMGTTTVVGKLLDLVTGAELSVFAELNAQIPYGADVISRVNASLDDSSELNALITVQIDHAIAKLLKAGGVVPSRVERVVIAGNTTMSYILLRLPCRSLGFAPFKPAYDYCATHSYQEVFNTDTLDCECLVMPYLSAYVGGDLTAGLCALGELDDFILMDMGTNGELVFKRGERLICTATAAGPAFEGGSIECGSGSIEGAISAVEYADGTFTCKTIGAALPTGICGSGILDLMAILVREGFIDKTGYLRDDMKAGRIVLAKGAVDPGNGDGDSGGDTRVGGEVFFSQKDVRQFQLAKSAVRTGLEIIMKEMGGAPPAQVFLAGGFGQNLNPASAIACGLLPSSFAGRVDAIGNSSLSGAAKLCYNEDARASLKNHAPDCQEINLATHPLFNDLFLDFMTF